MSPRPRSICGRLRMLPALPTGFRLCVPAFLSPCCDSSHPLAPHRPRLCCCEADLWVLMVIPRPNPQARRQAPNESPWQDLVGGSRREAPLMITAPTTAHNSQQPHAYKMRSPNVSAAAAAAGEVTEVRHMASVVSNVHEPFSVDSRTLRPQATRAIQQPNADGMRSPDVSTAVAAAGGATEACRTAKEVSTRGLLTSCGHQRRTASPSSRHQSPPSYVSRSDTCQHDAPWHESKGESAAAVCGEHTGAAYNLWSPAPHRKPKQPPPVATIIREPIQHMSARCAVARVKG